MHIYQSIATVFFVVVATLQNASAFDGNRDYFVFLTTGKSTQGIAPEIISQKQVAHIDNFKRLAKLGSLTIAGPCSDPDKKTRGIVVIHADSISDAESKFGPDPYVSEGFMKAELHPFTTIVGKLKLVDETATMEESVIVIVNRGKNWTEQSKDKSIGELASFAEKQLEDGKLGFAAQFTGKSNNDSSRLAVMIFRGKDVDAVKKAMESNAMVRDEKVTIQAFPQYLGKGAIE